jgi:hypothetical protein
VIPDGQYTAVVDRIEDGLAAVLIEQSDTDIYELLVKPEDLPEGGQQADAVLTVELRDEELIEADYEVGETEQRRESAQNRFDRLSERPESKDKE